MHAANPDRSFRLKHALDYLKDAGSYGVTTAQLQVATFSMAPATDVSELRQSGYLIDCTNEGTNENGRKVYRYTYRGRTYTP